MPARMSRKNWGPLLLSQGYSIQNPSGFLLFSSPNSLILGFEFHYESKWRAWFRIPCPAPWLRQARRNGLDMSPAKACPERSMRWKRGHEEWCSLLKTPVRLMHSSPLLIAFNTPSHAHLFTSHSSALKMNFEYINADIQFVVNRILSSKHC